MQMITAMNKCYHKTTHMFRACVPKTIAEAQQLDKENGNTLLIAAFRLELANVLVAFRILNDDEGVPIGYQKIDRHFIFDVKMEDLQESELCSRGTYDESTESANLCKCSFL